MSKTPRSGRRSGKGLRSGYKVDYSQAKPNRFASRLKRPIVAVVLDADVAAAFDSSSKVNAQLRSSIAKKQRSSLRRRAARRKAG